MIIRGSNSFPARRDVVTIECNVTANPPANITWMKRTNQRIQILANTQRITITHQFTYTPGGPTLRSTLTVYDVEAADNGDYICEASNGPSSSSLSADFTVCVIGISQLILELIHIMFFTIRDYSSRVCHCNTSQSSDNSIRKSSIQLHRMSNTCAIVNVEFHRKGRA